jgi:multisubunit Na+/H+ antiporter MnhB subunit
VRVEVVGGLVFIAFAFALLYLAAALPPTLVPHAPPSIPERPLQQWLTTFRALDVAFLALAVFAATLGVAALFRPEGERPGPEEEAFVEGGVEVEAEAGEEE